MAQGTGSHVITKFPPPYTTDANHTTQTDFHPAVKKHCTGHVTSSLRTCKVVLVGDVAVGKTSLVRRFCHNMFDRDYKATIGVDFEVEKFAVLSVPVSLQIWDTAGQERFKCIAASYYRSAHVVIVVFDLGDLHSLSSAARWRDEACAHAPEAAVYLVGTQADKVKDHVLREAEAAAVPAALAMGAEYWSVSALTGQSVSSLFSRVVALQLDAAVQRELRHDGSKVIGDQLLKVDLDGRDLVERDRKSGCC